MLTDGDMQDMRNAERLAEDERLWGSLGERRSFAGYLYANSRFNESGEFGYALIERNENHPLIAEYRVWLTDQRKRYNPWPLGLALLAIVALAVWWTV